jgi:hypothetical protein
MAGEVLLGDFMEAEEAADFMGAEEAADFMGVEAEADFMGAAADSVEVEVEVGEVTAKRHSLFPINYPDQYSGLLRLGRFGTMPLNKEERTMNKKIVTTIFIVLGLAVGYAALAGAEATGKATPVITQAFASNELRAGDTWKVYPSGA